MNQKKDRFHRVDFLFCVRGPYQADQQLQIQNRIQDPPLPTAVGQQLQPRFPDKW